MILRYYMQSTKCMKFTKKMFYERTLLFFAIHVGRNCVVRYVLHFYARQELAPDCDQSNKNGFRLVFLF